MTIPTIQFEGRLMGYTKTRDKEGNWVAIKLQVHPDEAAPLNSIDLGQRLQCVVVPIDDNEQPLPVKPKGGELARRAGILCNDSRFWDWIIERGRTYLDPLLFDKDAAAEWLRLECHVESRADLDHDQSAAERFLAVERDFKAAHGMVAEKRG